MSVGRVIVAFGDGSLGGTSRSALTAGQSWSDLGFEVSYLPMIPMNADRLVRFEKVGSIVSRVSDIPWAETALLHLHHSAWSKLQLDFSRDLISSARSHNSAVPLLTTNIFAVADRHLNRWPGARGVSVLGHWAALQYRLNMGSPARPWILPNRLDEEFFRPPVRAEREQARQAVGFRSGPLVLRIGSPNPAKWSRHYFALAQALKKVNGTLLCVGSPPDFHSRFRDLGNVHIAAQTSSDEELRQFYWAADVFAHDSARGESFGNVAIESLMSGLPVVYHGHPFRDNTPWEFRDCDGFFYERTAGTWISTTVRRAHERFMAGPTAVPTDVHVVSSRYGNNAIVSHYALAFNALSTSPAGSVVRPPAVTVENPFDLGSVLSSSLFHNPVVAKMKDWRIYARTS